MKFGNKGLTADEEAGGAFIAKFGRTGSNGDEEAMGAFIPLFAKTGSKAVEDAEVAFTPGDPVKRSIVGPLFWTIGFPIKGLRLLGVNMLKILPKRSLPSFLTGVPTAVWLFSGTSGSAS